MFAVAAWKGEEGNCRIGVMAPQLLSVVVRGKKVACPGAHLLLGAVSSSRRRDGLEIRLPDERHVQALQAVVGYLGDGKMEGVDTHNAAEVFDCTRLLGLNEARDAAEETLLRRVAPANCVALRQLASQRSLPRLRLACDSFLSDSFASVLLEKSALELPRVQVRLDVSSQLPDLGGGDLLEKVVPRVLSALESVRCRSRHLGEAVVRLVMRADCTVSEWSQKNSEGLFAAPLSPERNSPEFYAKLRGGCPPARQLILTPGGSERTGEAWKMRLVATTKLTDASAVCLVEVDSSLLLVSLSLCTVLHNGHLPASPTTGLPTFSQTSGCFMSHMSQARSGFGVVATETEILAVGGFNRGGCLDSTESYNSITNSWKDTEKMSGVRGRLCTTLVGDKIYAIGGSDGKRELSSVEVLHLSKDPHRWEKLEAAMPTPRSCLGAAVLDGVVYVVGGEHYSVPLKTAEAFDTASRTWRTLSPTNIARSDVAVAACAGKVYAIGGRAPGLKCLSSVEAFDPARNTWSLVANMKCPRRNAAAVTVGDKVMVVGGYSGTKVLRSVEIYDPAKDEWSECASLCCVRSHAAAVVYNQQVYVFGGYSGHIFLNTAECFDLRTEQWTPFA